MFNKIPPILTAQEIIDRAFKKAKKIQIADRNALYKKKKTVIARIDSFSNTNISILEKYVKIFPSIDNLHPFYQEIIDIRIDKNKLKKSLGAVDWARKTIQSIYLKQSRFLKKSGKIDFLIQKQKEIYGRISSIIKQIKKELDFLSEAQKIMKKFPDIKEIPTVVIAGYPNVGKSSILKCLSKAKPEIAVYPFTTKEIHVGHIERNVRNIKERYQIIDTPGLLDRPFSERNKIEKQAISALSNLADIIVFAIDSSETCGYSLEKQENLLKNLKKLFNKSAFIIVENKSDLKIKGLKYLKISCKTNEGIDSLKEKIFSSYETIKK